MSKKISNTKRSGLSIARVDRNRLDTLYYQLMDLVKESELGPDYDHFFARPKDVSSENSIDWYTELTGQATAIVELSVEDAQTAVAKFEVMVQKLRERADFLRSSGDRSSADLLSNALTIPDKKYIYSIDGLIVITCWGFSNAENDIVRNGEISETIKEKITPKPVEKPAAVQKEAVAEPEPVQKEAVVEPEPVQKEEKTESEKTKVEDTQPVSPPETVKKKSKFLPILLLLLLLALAALAVWYFLVKTPPKEDLSFLKGSHTAEGILENREGERVDLQLNFPDDTGQGSGVITSPKKKCTGSVTAHLGANNTVHLSLGTFTCPDNDHFDPFTIECRRDTNDCTGRNAGGGDSWKIKLNFNK